MPENIEIDFTSGTKAMSVGVVLAGFHFRCNRLNYVSGKRKNGIVISGTEKIISIPTAEILASEELKLALNMIEHLRFDSALQVLESIHPEILSEKDRALHKNLQKIAGAYKYWDLFHHNKFLELYNKVEFDKLTDQFRLPSGSLEIINVINKNVKDKALKKVNDKRIFEYIIVDLFCNAWRRFYEGKYDDAVARLYRTIELLAQTQLQIKYHIITNDVDINRLPPAFSDRLNHNKDPKDGRIKIGLQQDYQLLKELKDPLGERVCDNSELQELLRKRNHSILAHGLTPVGKETADKLLTQTLDLITSMVEDFTDLTQKLNFPWLAHTLARTLNL